MNLLLGQILAILFWASVALILYHLFGYPWPSDAVQWGHIARHLEELRFSPPPDATPYERLRSLTEGKDRFVITSNADDLFERTRARLSGPGHLLDRMKGFWTYFAAAFTEGPALAKEIHRTFQLPRYIDTVERFFLENATWRSSAKRTAEE